MRYAQVRQAGKPEKSGLIAYAEIKGRCGGAKGCTEWGISADRLTRAGLNDRTASAQTGRRYSLLLRETVGAKDYSDYTPSIFRKSNTDELNGHLPVNANMGRFIHPGGETVIKELTAPASVTDAQLVDVEDGYAGTPIYVRTAKSDPQEVTYTGSPTITDNGGIKTYSFSGGGSYTPSRIQGIDKSQYEDYGNKQGATSVIRRLLSFGSAVSRPANPTRVTRVTVRNTRSSPVTISPGSTATLTAVSSTLYDCTTWENYYTAPSYDYIGYFASSGASGGSGGSVTVKPYAPEIVKAQRLQQGKLTPATTRDIKYDYYTYIPSDTEEATKTVLASAGSTAAQNFAFDIDIDE